MLNIDFKKCGGCISVSVTGHAGFAEYGKDIVCAAVSALIGALAYRVKELEERGAFREKPTVKLESGNALIRCRPRWGCTRQTMEAFEMIESGCLLIWLDYAKYIDLKTFQEE